MYPHGRFHATQYSPYSRGLVWEEEHWFFSGKEEKRDLLIFPIPKERESWSGANASHSHYHSLQSYYLVGILTRFTPNNNITSFQSIEFLGKSRSSRMHLVQASWLLRLIISVLCVCCPLYPFRIHCIPLCRKVPAKLIVFRPIFPKMADLAGCGWLLKLAGAKPQKFKLSGIILHNSVYVIALLHLVS